MAGHTGEVPPGWSTGVDSTGDWAAEPASGARFRTLPAGTYQIGLSDEELAAAKRIEEPNLTAEELRPVITVTLPTLLVAEWETMCRSGASTLFPWGFGGLFFGEWCADRYRPSHDSGAEEQQGAQVIKGGGSQFWPWQDCGEWVWCMPAVRMPSTGLDVDGRCAARLVLGASREQ